ncbi:hypothetical protein BOTCAL_0056g00270 [Botryotinia calthae]|uniref:Uncharacterized protein n=1 Tax=Botryotinia calthae TaxID=38488 RepID=A0A4Y8DCW0_9HELO|nr:hypothetical protein BOTCAL_0056g00270 [Botryotinia calthae]
MGNPKTGADKDIVGGVLDAGYAIDGFFKNITASARIINGRCEICFCEKGPPADRSGTEIRKITRFVI